MWIYCTVLVNVIHGAVSIGYPDQPWIERYHNPYPWGKLMPSRYIEGTDYMVPEDIYTPDYRIPERQFKVHKEFFFREENRPYRITPHHILTKMWAKVNKKENPELLGCSCTTVYLRYHTLAGCAVITTRHILTTATSTHLILKPRKNFKNLEKILGAWYDVDANVANSSMYMTPARIHYHPKYIHPENVNVSHPLPVIFDLAVWAATYPFYGSTWSWSRAVICNRGGSHRFSYAPSNPSGELLLIVGFQYLLAWDRRPLPWMKYALRTRDFVQPCPKTEWGWFHCIPGEWAKFGVESGASLHRSYEGTSWRYDGLIGLNAFTMKLRTLSLIHYFQVLDNHPVLDFLYDSYMGRLPYEYLDNRFYDTKGRAPFPKPWFWIPWRYEWGYQPDYKKPIYS